MAFELHHRLEADCFPIGDSTLSRVLLMNDARFPWIILVPRRPDKRDLHDLEAPDRATLLEEIDAISRLLVDRFDAHKINVAALGNQVPQLHIHVIARRTDDAAWPAPVWGSGAPRPYPDGPSEAAAMRRGLGL